MSGYVMVNRDDLARVLGALDPIYIDHERDAAEARLRLALGCQHEWRLAMHNTARICTRCGHAEGIRVAPSDPIR